jgi:thiol-disulfide isomerase/thioredoxin
MGKLTEAIDAYNAQKKERLAPDVLATMNQAVEELKALGIERRALRTGDTMPDFTLPNQHGEPRSLSGYLARSPIVLNIYRGSWCPYCNL